LYIHGRQDPLIGDIAANGENLLSWAVFSSLPHSQKPISMPAITSFHPVADAWFCLEQLGFGGVLFNFSADLVGPPTGKPVAPHVNSIQTSFDLNPGAVAIARI
jgi:hypothetical protein